MRSATSDEERDGDEEATQGPGSKQMADPKIEHMRKIDGRLDNIRVGKDTKRQLCINCCLTKLVCARFR